MDDDLQRPVRSSDFLVVITGFALNLISAFEALAEGTGNYALGASTIDVLNAVVRRDSTDYALERISRSDYINIPTKSTKARPSQFFVDRQINPTLKLWPVPENSTDTVIIDKLVRMDDADTFINTMDVPFRFYPCFPVTIPVL